eukprot:3220504-Rhodomonas_salina.1
MGRLVLAMSQKKGGFSNLVYRRSRRKAEGGSQKQFLAVLVPPQGRCYLLRLGAALGLTALVQTHPPQYHVAPVQKKTGSVLYGSGTNACSSLGYVSTAQRRAPYGMSVPRSAYQHTLDQYRKKRSSIRYGLPARVIHGSQSEPW